MITSEKEIIWTEDDYDHESLVLVEEEMININTTKLKETRINEIVGICVKLLLKRTFKTKFSMFEEVFVKDLRKAIWGVLALHANHLRRSE